MELTGAQTHQFMTALLAAFGNGADLAHMVRRGLDVNLTTITHGPNLAEDVLKSSRQVAQIGHLSLLEML